VADERTLGGLADELPSADEVVDQAEQLVLLAGCVNQLGVIQRKVVTLRMLDEVPGEDVAAELTISPQNVAVQLHRAKRRLRECMDAVTAALQGPDETLS
jgi:RNA polymerase sigma-70 factor (ECF subfamily)